MVASSNNKTKTPKVEKRDYVAINKAINERIQKYEKIRMHK